MTDITVCEPAQLLALQSYAAYLDSGSGAAHITYYMGAKPANLAISADPNNALCTLYFPEPCFKQVLADGIELFETSTELATKAGTVTWARLYNGNGDVFCDFDVGILNAHIVLNSVDIALGSNQKLDSVILNLI